MIRKLPSFLITALLLMAVSAPAIADRPWLKWTPQDGRPVRQGDHLEWFRGGEGRYDGQHSGEVGLIWSDCRWTNTETGDRGIFYEVIDQQGNLKFGSGANGYGGRKVADANNRQEDPAIYPSSDGGWYMVWEDFDADSAGDIYCTKFNNAGEKLWGNGERGVPVCVMDNIQEDVRVTDDGQGGCIIAWRDKRGGDPANIYAQRMLANGTAAWQENGLPVTTANSIQDAHTADTDGHGGMIIAWRDNQTGNPDIRAQRITIDGRMAWGNGEPIIVCGYQSAQEQPKLCPDGSGGVFMSWVDDRGGIQTNKDIYAQHITQDGTLLWNPDGEIVCNAAEEQVNSRIIDNTPGEAIIAWEDKRTDRVTSDIYAQRISGAGNRMRKEWTDFPQGRPVFVLPGTNQAEVRLFPDNQGGAYFTQEDERDGGFPEVDIWAHHLTRAGALIWAENGIPICRVPRNQNGPLVRRLADGGALFAWGDYRTGSLGLWAQKVNYNGDILWDVDGIPIQQWIGGNAKEPHLIPRTNDSFTALWSDGRFGGNGTVPFVQTVRNLGDQEELVMVPGGVSVMVTNLGGGLLPDGVADNSNGTIVVWEDHRAGETYAIYAQRINTTGERLWGDMGVKVAEYDFEQTTPRVCSDGQNGCIVAWRASAASGNGDNDLFIQRLDAGGNRLWGAGGITLASTADDEAIEQLIADGDGGAVVTWVRTSITPEQSLDDNLFATRVNANGDKLWNGANGGVSICAARNQQGNSRIAKHSFGFVVVWEDKRDEEISDIYAQFINPDGTLRWRINGAALCSADGDQTNPSIATNNAGKIWVAFEDWSMVGTPQMRDVYLQRINSYDPLQNGDLNLAFTDFELNGLGIAICDTVKDQTSPIIADDGQGGVWVCWQDYQRGTLWQDIYATHRDPSGALYARWERNGNPVCTGFHKQENNMVANLLPRGESGAVVLWEDKRATGKEDISNIFCQRLDGSPLAISREANQAVPRGFELLSLYPNPFNSRTFVTYATQGEGVVKVTLFDAVGRQAALLLNESQSAGVHHLQLNAEGLSSGTYLLRFEVAGRSFEQKIQLLK